MSPEYVVECAVAVVVCCVAFIAVLGTAKVTYLVVTNFTKQY